MKFAIFNHVDGCISVLSMAGDMVSMSSVEWRESTRSRLGDMYALNVEANAVAFNGDNGIPTLPIVPPV